MRHVYLPVEHSGSDIALAGEVAELLESGSLFVTWSVGGDEAPPVQAAVRVVAPSTAVAPLAAAPRLLAGVLGCMTALVAGLLAIRGERAAARAVSSA